MHAVDDLGSLSVSPDATGALYPKLRPGPGRSADLVVAHQRARLRGAMIEMVAERGYDRVTVRGLARLAGVSTKTFYDCFENVGDCFTATYLWIVRTMVRRVLVADGEGDEARIRARVGAVFTFLAENPKAARLILVDGITAGLPSGGQVRASSVAIERLIGEELRAGASGGPVCEVLPQAVIGAAMRVARHSLLKGDSAQLSEFVDPFSDWLLAIRNGRSLNGAWRSRGFEHPSGLGQPRSFTANHGDERRLLLAATVKLGLRMGFPNLTAPAIRREAGVSRRVFADNFDGTIDCFLSAVEFVIFETYDWAEREVRDSGPWERGVIRTLDCLLNMLASEPALARFALVEILAPGLPGLIRQEEIISRLAGRFRDSMPAPARTSQSVAEASIAGVWRVANRHVAEGRSSRLPELLGGMAFVLLAPTVGTPGARRVIGASFQPS